MIDNLYIIVPLLRNSPEQLQDVLLKVVELLFLPQNKLDVDLINLDAVFNDVSLVKDLFVSFMNLLSKYSDADESLKEKNLKGLNKLIEFLNEVEL